jgi:multiple sugar transport system substrate-binding protein
MKKKDGRNRHKGVTRRKFLKMAGAAGATLMVSAPFVHTKETITLRVLSQEPDPGTIKVLESNFAEWESKTGVKVTLDTVPGGEVFPKLTASIKAGNPYHLANELFIGNINIMAANGWIVPLTDMIKKIGVDDFGPNILFPMKGEYWWYPYDYNFAYWFYRTDLFKKHGLKEPKTWADFLNCAKACTADNMFGLGLGIGNGQWVDWLNVGFMWADGVKLFDNKWNVIFDSPQMKPKVVKFLNFFKELYKYMPPGMTQIVWADHVKLVVSERVAMNPYSGRMIEHIDTYAPHLADKVGAFLYPSSDGSRFAVGHGYDGWFVVKTKYTEEAMKLLRWLVTDKLIDFYASLPIHYQPTRMSIYNDPRWKALPRVKKYANVVETTKNFLTRKDIVIDCVDIQGPEIDPRPGKITRKFVMPTMFQNLLLKNMTPEECVKIAADQIREVIKEG